MFRLPIVKFFSRILNRITITVVLVALQVAWLLWAFFSLTTGRVWVNAGLQLLSLFMMLYLVRKDENSAYKIGWIALMGVLPLLGGANRLLGLCLGLVTGALDCWLVALALWFAAGITAGKFDWLTPAALQQSVGYSIFGAVNPVFVHY